jgi:hypothetical protein
MGDSHSFCCSFVGHMENCREDSILTFFKPYLYLILCFQFPMNWE